MYVPCLNYHNIKGRAINFLYVSYKDYGRDKGVDTPGLFLRLIQCLDIFHDFFFLLFQTQCRSPVIFKFDDPQMLLQQHQRKDSASSEVAGFLCISGRSSRISSVGSQGSGVSRLSAVSGVSRSPSPHKMLVETSFCGPKPLQDGTEPSAEPNVEALEQVLLARKHDPTQVVLAEGVKVDASTPKRKIVPPMEDGTSNKTRTSVEKKPEVIHKAPEVRITRPSAGSGGGVIARGIAAAKLGAAASKKEPTKVVVGVMPSGTEYVRINLKPDLLYPDKGVAPGEKVVDASELQKKPASLNLSRESRKTAQEQQRIQSASPKPARHQALARDTGSRSPSPALNISRKSSFCSLFKSNKDKESNASPDSPTVRDRSRSRSKGRDSMTNESQTGTPSKQKSVLAIFKPKRSGSKSKCSSPIDPEMSSGGDVQTAAHETTHKTKASSYKPPGKEHLRYYESGEVIEIPLHTPPEEKELGGAKKTNVTSARVEPVPRMSVPPPPPPPMPPKTSPSHNASSNTTPVKGGIQVLPLGPPLGPIILKKTSTPATTLEETKPRIPEGVQVLPLGPPLGPIYLKKTPEKTETQTPKPKPKPLMKLKHVEQSDGSILIPLKSPSDTDKDDNKSEDKTWSMEVQRHSSQDSQETVISSTHLHSGDENSALPNNVSCNSTRHNSNTSQANGVVPPLSSQQQQQNNSNKSMSPVPTPGAPPPTPAVPQNTREKKHILFTTKLGSGSEDGVFATQFSLSKTESLCSQLSEQTSVFNSPTEKDPPTNTNNQTIQRSDTVVKREDSSGSSSSVVMRRKDSTNESKRKSHREMGIVDDQELPQIPTPPEPAERSESAKKKDDPTSRLSRYVDPNEIIEAQKKLEALRAKKREAKRLEEEERLMKEKEQLEPATKDTEVHREKFVEEKQSLDIPKTSRDKSLGSSAEDIVSESEKESEAPSTSQVSTQRISARVARGALEEESTGLVFQESFDDELPYVPTTLPEERGQGVQLIPMKERAQIEVRTCPLERPRSRTPMTPNRIDNYSATSAADSSDSSKSGEKLKISLPKRTDSGRDKNRQKSPRRISNGSGKTWFDFGEAGGEQSDEKRGSAPEEDPPPPPLPPRKPSQTQQWIDFDNIPEKRKPPKRITTIPSKESSQDKGHIVQYNYVNPEECQCECHETERHSQTPVSDSRQQQTPTSGEEAQPLLEDRQRSR